MGKLDAIKVLIGINVIVAAITFLTTSEVKEMMFTNLALFFPKNEHFRFWQFISNMFMHGGWAHLFFNMFGLWSFGTPLEMMWGKKRFLFFYFLSGLGAGIIYTLVNYYQFNSIYNELIAAGLSGPDIQKILTSGSYNSQLASVTVEKITEFYSLYQTPAVGASGAIYGVLVAFGMSFPNAKLAMMFIPVPIAAKFFIPIIIALDLFSGVTGFSIFGGGIAHFAHVGGAIFGFILMWIWRKSGKVQSIEEL